MLAAPSEMNGASQTTMAKRDGEGGWRRRSAWNRHPRRSAEPKQTAIAVACESEAGTDEADRRVA